jgi:zinc protease
MTAHAASVLSLGLLLAAQPFSAQAIPDRPEKVVIKPLAFQVPQAKEARIKLKNGITAYLVPDPTGQPMVTLSVLVRGGSYLEPKGKEGLAGLMATLLRTGGTQSLAADKLDERLDFLAANAGVSLAQDQATVTAYLNLLEKDSVEGIGILLDLLTQPAFAQDRLDLAKKNLRQQMERRNDETPSIEGYQMGFLLRGEDYYTNHLPTGASVEAITRTDLVALHARLLHPENLILSVAGRFDRKAMAALLDRTFGTLKAGPGALKSGPVPKPTHMLQPGIYVSGKDVNQGRVAMALPGLRRADPDWPSVEVMSFILGGDFTSRLVMKIRTEEGLAYSVSSRFTPGMFFPGDFRASFQTKTRTVAYGVRLLLAELDKIRKDPVKDEELARAKGALIEGFPAQFANKAQVAGLFMREDYFGAPEDYWITYRDRIRAVTREDILRVAQKYLQPDKLVILAVGNPKDMEEGDVKDHPGKLSESARLPVVPLPLRDPMTMQVMK